jgi:hypothetical protein
MTILRARAGTRLAGRKLAGVDDVRNVLLSLVGSAVQW